MPIPIPISTPISIADNMVLPYKIEGLDAQGRVVRLGHELHTILSRHDYPEPIARLLGEAMVLTVMLGSSLKFDGRFVVQTQSDGLVPMLICDMKTSGEIRAYAKIDHAKLALYGKNPSQAVLLGQGHIAFSVEQGADMENYQGIVPLEGELIDTAHMYFARSEQIETRVKLAAQKVALPDGETHWRAGGILLQQTAHEGGRRDDGRAARCSDDDWRRLTALLETTEKAELLHPELDAETLVFRLFNEDGVRVFKTRKVHFACTCSKSRIENIIKTFSDEEIYDSLEDGMIKVGCEFCNAKYTFDPALFITLS